MDIMGCDVTAYFDPFRNSVTVYIDGHIYGGGCRCFASGDPHETGDCYMPTWTGDGIVADRDRPVLEDRRAFLEYFVSAHESRPLGTP